MWNTVLSKWVRTGKTVATGLRKAQHNKGKDTKDELFYKTCRDRLDDLVFYKSITFDAALVDEATRFMVYGKEIERHLNATTTK